MFTGSVVMILMLRWPSCGVLYVLDMTDLDRSTLEARPSAAPGVVGVLQARILGWGYPPHTHDTWAVLVVDEGAIDYRLGDRRYEAVTGTVTLLPPDVAHDGRPAASGGAFRKRELYLAWDFLPVALRGAAVDRTNLRDPALAAAVRGLHTSLDRKSVV